MDMKICSTIFTIEELTSMKDYMQQVPNEIEKMSADIQACRNVYEILNKFSYKFPDDESYDKQWKAFGAPKYTMQKIDEQQKRLESQKEGLIQEMQAK